MAAHHGQQPNVAAQSPLLISLCHWREWPSDAHQPLPLLALHCQTSFAVNPEHALEIRQHAQKMLGERAISYN